MAKRRRPLGNFQNLVQGISRDLRESARQRERELRRGRSAAQRQDRVLSRLAREQEREEARASAREEHEENEEFLQSLSSLLKLAPPRIRARPDFEGKLSPEPFPPPERLAADAARLEQEVVARVARTVPPRQLGLFALVFFGALGLLSGLVLAFPRPAVGLSLAVGGAILWWLSARALRQRQEAFRRSEEARARSEVAGELAAQLQKDRAEHERREAERIEKLRRLLAGDPDVCREAFASAAESLDLPLGASAALAMLSPEVAQVDINLHPAEEIPVQQSTLLKTGRISYRNRPQREIREDEARAVASLGLLYGALALDALPSLQDVVVSALRPGVDPATGHDCELCFASAILDREAFSSLKLDRIDPVAAIRAFPSRFSCSVSYILKPVQPFSPEDFSESGAARVPGPTATATALEVAQHALSLAMACARADGRLSEEEVQRISTLLEQQFPLSPAASRRLSLRRAALTEEAIEIEGPARALRGLLAPRERALLLEQMLSVVVADGKAEEGELSLLRSIGAALDVPPAVLDGLLKAWTPAAGQEPSGAPGGERARWIAALELPQDASLDRLTVERAGRRLQDLYADERFRLLAPELREMAARRRELAAMAMEGLLREFPEAPAEAKAEEAKPGAVRRDNPDLDSIFGHRE